MFKSGHRAPFGIGIPSIQSLSMPTKVLRQSLKSVIVLEFRLYNAYGVHASPKISGRPSLLSDYRIE